MFKSVDFNMTATLHCVIQIVADLPPSINGVGDYALGVARALRVRHGVESVFLVAGQSPARANELEGFRVVHLDRQNGNVLARVLAGEVNDDCAVLVQYVGYGFDKNGAPRWMVDGLDHWRRTIPERRLVTMFHELYATSRPWRRAFWFSLRQKELAKRLACMSDGCVTSLEQSADRIRQWRGRSRGGQSVSVVEIPSNVGEPEAIRPLGEREPSMVVFGSYGNRRNAYQKTLREMIQSCSLLGIKEIIDVGPGEIAGAELLLPSVRYRRTGALDAESVSALLQRSRAGFLNYPASILAKSGIFAAYCAHGVLPVLAKKISIGKGGIEEGRHYWYPRFGAVTQEGMQAIATEAHTWYGKHNLGKHALLFAGMLGCSIE